MILDGIKAKLLSDTADFAARQFVRSRAVHFFPDLPEFMGILNLTNRSLEDAARRAVAADGGQTKSGPDQPLNLSEASVRTMLNNRGVSLNKANGARVAVRFVSVEVGNQALAERLSDIDLIECCTLHAPKIAEFIDGLGVDLEEFRAAHALKPELFDDLGKGRLINRGFAGWLLVTLAGEVGVRFEERAEAFFRSHGPLFVQVNKSGTYASALDRYDRSIMQAKIQFKG